MTSLRDHGREHEHITHFPYMKLREFASNNVVSVTDYFLRVSKALPSYNVRMDECNWSSNTEKKVCTEKQFAKNGISSFIVNHGGVV